MVRSLDDTQKLAPPRRSDRDKTVVTSPSSLDTFPSVDILELAAPLGSFAHVLSFGCVEDGFGEPERVEHRHVVSCAGANRVVLDAFDIGCIGIKRRMKERGSEVCVSGGIEEGEEHGGQVLGQRGD
jgi:hypothetical protein